MIEELIIAFVQGLTEFFPVSSSAHIALLEHLFGLFKPVLIREVVLHLATLFAILIFLRKKIWDLLYSWIKGERLNYLMALIVGSSPAALFGLGFKKLVEQAFSSVRAIGFFMLANAFILLLSRAAKERKVALNWTRAFIIGIAQALALFPGISRSGSTITVALLLGLDREEAFDFSFLLAIPAILGASFLEIKEAGIGNLDDLLLPFVFAFASGFTALAFLRKIVKKQQFYLFAPYVIIIAALALILGG